MKISIVIPTRNRCEFLPYCVQTCLACDDAGLEVVVSNNNSQDATRQALEPFIDRRLKVVHTPRDLSMRQNFEFALAHTTGDYVIFIGDDDGVLPNGLAALRYLLQQHNPDAVIWRHITYIWPHQHPVPTPGVLKFRARDFCGPMRSLDPRQLLEDFCNARRVNYRDGLNIYHGCIARRVIDRVKQVGGGDYFHGLSPDINTALSNLVHARSALWMRNPVTIAGAGEKSTGSLMKKNAASTSPDQKAVEQGFVQLANADPIDGEADLQIRSLLAHTYASLDRVLRMHAHDAPPINHAGWREKIIQEVRAYPHEHHKWGLLESLFARLDPSYTEQHLAEREASSAAQSSSSPTPEQPAPPAKRKPGRAPHAHLVNIATAAHWIQQVTGRPYHPTPNAALARAKQLCRSLSMQANLMQTNRRPAQPLTPAAAHTRVAKANTPGVQP